MKQFTFDVTWIACGLVTVQAENEDQARAKAEDEPLPDCPEYVGGFEVNAVISVHELKEAA